MRVVKTDCAASLLSTFAASVVSMPDQLATLWYPYSCLVLHFHRGTQVCYLAARSRSVSPRSWSQLVVFSPIGPCEIVYIATATIWSASPNVEVTYHLLRRSISLDFLRDRSAHQNILLGYGSDAFQLFLYPLSEHGFTTILPRLPEPHSNVTNFHDTMEERNLQHWTPISRSHASVLRSCGADTKTARATSMNV